MQHRISRKLLSVVMLIAMLLTALPVAALGAYADSDVQLQQGTQVYSLFNSGATSLSGKEYSSATGVDRNPDSHSYNNSGYDIYGCSENKDLTLGMGLSFYVGEQVTERATLTVYAYDIDEESRQIDDVYLVNEATGVRTYVGSLSGRDETWSTSTLTIDASCFQKGNTYHFEVDVCQGGWWTWVRTVALEITLGSGGYVPTLEHSFSASISGSGVVNTSLYLKANYSAIYQLEYTATIQGQQKGGSEGRTISVSPSGATANVSFSLESGSPKGTYEIAVIVKDSNKNTVATYKTAAGYAYSAVSYHANGGSTNLPVDVNAYVSGQSVTVLFDYLPSRGGYTFLGWDTASDAVTPRYTQNGAKTFVIGSSDVVLYAVWQKNADLPVGGTDEWDGEIDPGFGGGNGTQTDPYLIYTAEQLAYLAQSTNSGNTYENCHFKLMNSLDLKGLAWEPIGKSVYTSDVYSTKTAFSGHFDGNYNVIYNLNFHSVSSSFTGLFGMVHKGSVQNLGIEASSIDYKGSYGSVRFTMGLLAGSSYLADFSRCYVLANVRVETSNYVDIGLLVGDFYSSTMTDCYACGDVNVKGGGAYFVGGLFGYHHFDAIRNCYFYGTVKGSGATLGPIWGGSYDNNGANLYYSANLSGFGTALSPNEMEQKASFAGFDFAEVWALEEDDAAPRLQYFTTGSSPVLCNHDYTESIVAPTCTEDGYTLYTCKICGTGYRDKVSERLGHLAGEWVTDQEPTCTASGRKHADCTRCGETLEDVYVPAFGHDWVTQVAKEVTCEEAGILTHSCSRCGHSYETYVYSEHAYEISDTKEAGCEADGWIEYTCHKCQGSYREIVPGGHKYAITVTKLATPTEEGLITYTCTECGHTYTEAIPVRPAATVLLVQDRIPWSSNDNVTLLNRLLSRGYINGWDMVTSAQLDAALLSSYGVVMIANDQNTSFYNNLAEFSDAFNAYVVSGGVLIYGACDNGWAGGDLTHALPGGVEKGDLLSRYNYIVDANHAIVAGYLTDGKALTNTLLYGNYCSHVFFDALPAGSNVILQNASGNPTLAEYSLGEGHVIVSGLTWEFYYNRNSYAGPSATYSKNVFDDLVVYAVSLSNPCDHIYDEGTVILPSCLQEGYTLHVCSSCGAQLRDEFVAKLDHVPGEWITVLAPTATQTGLAECYCTMCGEKQGEKILPVLGASGGKDGTLTIFSEVSEVYTNEEFKVIFAIDSAAQAVGSVDCHVLLSEGLEYVSHQILVAEEDYMLSAYLPGEGLFGCGMTLYGKSGSFSLLELTLKAKEVGVYSIGASLSALDEGVGNLVGDGKLDVAVGNAWVIRATEHSCVFDQKNTDEKYLVHGAECTRPACYRLSCVCGEVGGVGVFEVGAPLGHSFDHNCDTECNRCFETRTITHIYSKWEISAKQHWQICDCCGFTTEKENHQYADVYSRVCQICSHEHMGTDGTVQITTSRSDVVVDRIFDVYFTVNAKSQPVGAMDFRVILSEGLEYVSHEILVDEKDFALSAYVVEEGFFGCGMSLNGKDGSFSVLKLSLKAKDEGEYKVFVSLLGRDEGISDVVGSRVLDFICPQPLTLNAYHHVCSFDRHVAQDSYLIREATCTQAACYYVSCECGEKGEESFYFGDPLGHTPGAWLMDSEKHWHLCQVCGATEHEAAHDYSDFWDVQCNSCSFERSRPCLGDPNGDGVVNFSDIQRIYQHLSTVNKLSGDFLIIADANKDGIVSFGDIQRIYQHISTPNKLF